MGMYSTFAGEIKFKKKKDFDEFVKKITENEWYSPEKDSWASENGWVREEYEIDDPVVIKKTKTVNLPNIQINNFHRVINLLEPNTWEGHIHGASDDGTLEGWVIKPDGTEEVYDLEEWAKAHGKRLEWDEENEDWETDDRVSVMEDFLDNPYPPSNSHRFITDEEAS